MKGATQCYVQTAELTIQTARCAAANARRSSTEISSRQIRDNTGQARSWRARRWLSAFSGSLSLSLALSLARFPLYGAGGPRGKALPAVKPLRASFWGSSISPHGWPRSYLLYGYGCNRPLVHLLLCSMPRLEFSPA